jgi:hypothetical protein
MERLSLYYRRLKDIIIYSDTQVLELVLVLVITLINPSSIERLNHTPSFWSFAGIFLGLLLLIGIVQNCIVKRFWATNLLFTHSIGILAFEIIKGDLQSNQISYVIQAIVIGYITWKCGRESAHKSAIAKCRGGIKNGK